MKAIICFVACGISFSIAAGGPSPNGVPDDTAHINLQNGTTHRLPADSLDQDRPSVIFTDAVSSADREYRIGNGLAAGGLAALVGAYGLSMISGNHSGLQGTLSGWGFVAYQVGIPLMGNASGKLTELAIRGNPDYSASPGGWGFYGSGIVLQGGGAAWLIYEIFSHLEVGVVGPLVFPYENLTPSEILPPLLTLLAGEVCEGISWYKFSAHRRSARAALKADWSMAPTLNFDARDHLLPGAIFTASF